MRKRQILGAQRVLQCEVAVTCGHTSGRQIPLHFVNEVARQIQLQLGITETLPPLILKLLT